MKKVLVASHVSEVYAPTYPLIRFLKKKFPEPICILHPFKDGLVWFHFLKDFFVTLFFSLYYLRRYDVFIGVNCLNALPGLFVKVFRPSKKIIYYSADYSTKRFTSSFFNKLYLFLDKFCSRRADFCWSVSERIREVKRGFGVGEEKNILVPNGVHLSDIKLYDRKIKHSLFYVGHLTETKGIQDTIRALKELEGYQLLIIGDGPFRKNLEDLVLELGVRSKVTFLGKLSNKEVLKKIGQFEIGLAPYTDLEDYIYYCDPVKVKEYLAAGCPVVVSNAVWAADEVERREAGIAVDNFAHELPAAIGRIERKYQKMSQNAKDYAKKFDWDDTYTRAFARMKL